MLKINMLHLVDGLNNQKLNGITVPFKQITKRINIFVRGFYRRL